MLWKDGSETPWDACVARQPLERSAQPTGPLGSIPLVPLSVTEQSTVSAGCETFNNSRLLCR